LVDKYCSDLLWFVGFSSEKKFAVELQLVYYDTVF